MSLQLPSDVIAATCELLSYNELGRLMLTSRFWLENAFNYVAEIELRPGSSTPSKKSRLMANIPPHLWKSVTVYLQPHPIPIPDTTPTFNSLVTVTISGKHWTQKLGKDRPIETLGHLPSLTELTLRFLEFTAQVSDIVKPISDTVGPRLRHLSVSCCKFANDTPEQSNDALQYLSSKCTRLVSLSLCDRFTQFSALRTLTSLELLQLESHPLAMGGLAALLEVSEQLPAGVGVNFFNWATSVASRVIATKDPEQITDAFKRGLDPSGRRRFWRYLNHDFQLPLFRLNYLLLEEGTLLKDLFVLLTSFGCDASERIGGHTVFTESYAHRKENFVWGLVITHPEVLKPHLEADPSLFVGPFGTNLLMYALGSADSCNSHCIQQTIDVALNHYKIDPNYVDAFGDTALVYCRLEHHLAYLLTHSDIDIRIRNKEGRNAFEQLVFYTERKASVPANANPALPGRLLLLRPQLKHFTPPQVIKDFIGLYFSLVLRSEAQKRMTNELCEWILAQPPVESKELSAVAIEASNRNNIFSSGEISSKLGYSYCSAM